MADPKKREDESWDDGRTIANMNIEGMPWYNPSIKDRLSKRGEGKAGNNPANMGKDELGPGGTWAMIKGIMGAALGVGLIFAVVFGLFILILTWIW